LCLCSLVYNGGSKYGRQIIAPDVSQHNCIQIRTQALPNAIPRNAIFKRDTVIAQLQAGKTLDDLAV
jgi:hypothetical protein